MGKWTARLSATQGGVSENYRPATTSTPDHETILDYHDERRAILQFDGGLSADDAKDEAWTLTQKRYGLPDDYRPMLQPIT